MTAKTEALAAAVVAHLGGLAVAVQGLESGDVGGATEAMETPALTDAAALVQDLRKRLGDVERDLTVALGKREGKCSGELSDGRLFTLQRSSDRKAWDHDEWKRDVRRAVVEKVRTDLGLPKVATVLDVTGELTTLDLAAPLYQAVAEAQAVHGAQAPKSTSLKALGLYASDYCESSPAGWRLTVTPKSDNPTTTTQEN